MDKKEDIIDISRVAKRKLSDVEKQYISLQIEKLRISREKSILILNKGVFLFFTFLAFGIFAGFNNLISTQTLNILVIMGSLALVVSIMPYQTAAKKEEKKIDKMLNDLISI